jgi:CheY-like chemotaxis protein
MKPHDPADGQPDDPVEGPPNDPAAGPPGKIVSKPGARGRRLRPCAVVLERDPEVARALAGWLAPELDVQVAGSAVQAAAVLEQVPFVDLAFLDLELPTDLGEELLQQLGRWPDAIRVLLSKQLGATSSQLGTRQLQLPRNRYLAHLVLGKPVAPGIVHALKRATLGLPKI